MADKARHFALGVLRRVWEQGAYSNIEISHGLNRCPLTGIDKAFGVALVNGAVERRITLDFLIEKASGRALTDIEPELLTVLRMGFQQLFYMNVPDMAACSESVELVSGSKRRAFVNAVMRSACRNRAYLTESVEAASDSVRYSLSEDICAVISAQYPDEKDGIMAAFFDKAPLVLRANTLRISPDDLCRSLTADGAEAVSAGTAVVLTAGAEKGLEAVKSGLAFVQGLSSQAAVAALQAEPGQCVVDVCACPGGKSLGAALSMGNRGSVLAFDLHANKLSLIERSAAALGIDTVSARVHDGRTPLAELVGVADRVICDVPCSGIGAIKGKPEIRYKNLEDIGRLVRTQKDILRSAYTYLRSGGRLVYSTCSVNRDENEGVVSPFVGESGAVLVSERTVLPTEKWHDGFYIAVLEKK